MYEIFEKLLKEKGVTAYRVAQDTGVTTATLTSWKQGKYTPKKEKMQILADYFEVPLEYLLTGKMPTNDGFDETEINLIRSFRRLNKYGKEKILNDISDCLALPKYTEKNASHSEVV